MDWFSLVVGLLIGWIVGMLIDYFFWRPRRICTEAEQTLTASLRDAEANNQGLQTQLANFRVNGKRLETFEAELQDKEQQLASLASSYDSRETVLVEQETALNSRQHDLDNLALSLTGRKTELDDLAASYATTEQRLTNWEADLKAQEGTLADLNLSYENRGAELATLAASLNTRQATLEEQSATVTTNEARLADWDAQLEVHKTELSLLAANLDTRQQELDGVAANFASTEQRLTNWESQLQARDAQLAMLNTDIETQQQELTALEASLTMRQQELDKLNSELYGRSQALEQRQIELDAQLATLPTLKASQQQIAALEADLEAARAESTTLATQLEATGMAADDDFSMAGLGAGLVAAAGAAVAGLVARFDADEAPELLIDDPHHETGLITLAGTGQPNTAVEVLLDNNVVGATLVDENGRWQFPTTIYNDGDHIINTRYVNDDGAPQDLSEPYYLFLTTPREWAKLRTEEPVLGQMSSSDDGTVTGTFDMSGSGEPGTEIVFWIGEAEIGRTQVDADGQWQYSSAVTVPMGNHTIIARMVNDEGRSLMRSKSRLVYFGAPDDLKKIWGIGAKIEQLLNAQGIYTFAKLAETPLEFIDQLLAEAGPRFSLSNHEAWPEQARMAAEQAWDTLKEYQDKLDWKRGGLSS